MDVTEKRGKPCPGFRRMFISVLSELKKELFKRHMTTPRFKK
jgi:hypothetical protein